MNYKVTLAVGDRVFDRKVNAIHSIAVVDGTYMLRDEMGIAVFSAPYDSVVCIEQI